MRSVTFLRRLAHPAIMAFCTGLARYTDMMNRKGKPVLSLRVPGRPL